MQTIAACFVIVAVWLLLGLTLVGVGRVVRASSSGPLTTWRIGDFWIGLTVTLGSMYAVHLVLPVTSRYWLLLGPVGLYGLVRWSRWPRLPARSDVAPLALTGTAVLYVANRALQPLGAYDSFLYGLQVARWTHTYKAVPGLANLHSRLGYNSASMMFDALVGSTVNARYTHHFANSLLLMVLVLETLLALRLLASSRPGSASRAPQVLLVLSAPLLLSVLSRAIYITSLTPDLPAFVVTLAAAYYVTQILVTRDEASDAWPVALCLLVLMPMVRIQLGAMTVVLVLALVGAAATRRIVLPARRRTLIGSAAIPAAAGGLFAVHGVVLSGYPAFPAPVLGAPVSWAVPRQRATLEIDIIQAWARDASAPRAQVLGNFSWAPRWARIQSESTSLVSIALIAATALILLSLAVGIRLGAQRRQGRPITMRTQAVIGVLTLTGGATALGIGVASRHHHSLALVLAPAICLALVILAMSFAAGFDRVPFPDLGALAAVALAALVFVTAWALTAPTPRFAFGGLTLFATAPATMAVLALRQWGGKALAVGAMAALVVSGSAFQIYKLGSMGLAPIVADGPGWLGLSPPQAVQTHVITLSDGTQVRTPVTSDQCGDAPLPCTPFTDGSWAYVDPSRLDRGFVAAP